MAAPARRALARYPCDIAVAVYAFIREVRAAQGRFINLSLGGALLRCTSPLGRGVTYFFRFSWGETLLELPGRVVWSGPRDPRRPEAHLYGIELNLTRDQEQFLRGLVESIKPAAPPPRDLMRDYWDGKPRDVE